MRLGVGTLCHGIDLLTPSLRPEFRNGSMTSTRPTFGIDRRALLATTTLSALFAAARPLARPARADEDPLPSWNAGPAKQAILDFVRDTTDRASAKFVPPDERIAAFDQDGTLWVEHPMYCQMLCCFDRVPALAAQNQR